MSTVNNEPPKQKNEPLSKDENTITQRVDDGGILGDFWIAVKEQGQLIAWVVAGASTTPLILGMAGINPPWPKNVVVMTAFGQLLAMIWAYQTLRGKKSDVAIEHAMRFYLRLLTLFVGLYFMVHSLFVYTIPTNHELGVKGFICLPDVLKISGMAQDCPFVPLEKLKGFGYESIWVLWSVSMVQYSILCLWIASFYSLAFFLAAFVVNQQNKIGESNSE